MTKLTQAISAFLVVVFIGSGCKKTDFTPPPLPLDLNSSQVSVNNGVVTFANTAAFTKIIENKNGEFLKLKKILENDNFSSLQTRQHFSSFTNQVDPGNPAPLTSDFDSTLYTDFNITVLNTQKILSVSGFFVKVDMDNDFCTIIDDAVPDAYNILASNDLSNPNIHEFVSSDEPVIAVIDGLRSGTITWEGYQTELAKKGGGICFKKGHSEAKGIQQAPVGPNYTLYIIAQYTKNFLSFQFNFRTYVAYNNYPGLNLPTLVGYSYSYSYETACGNTNNGSAVSIGVNPQQSFYSGGTALKNIYFSGYSNTSIEPYNAATPVLILN